MDTKRTRLFYQLLKIDSCLINEMLFLKAWLWQLLLLLCKKTILLKLKQHMNTFNSLGRSSFQPKWFRAGFINSQLSISISDCHSWILALSKFMMDKFSREKTAGEVSTSDLCYSLFYLLSGQSLPIFFTLMYMVRLLILTFWKTTIWHKA